MRALDLVIQLNRIDLLLHESLEYLGKCAAGLCTPCGSNQATIDATHDYVRRQATGCARLQRMIDRFTEREKDWVRRKFQKDFAAQCRALGANPNWEEARS